MALFTSVLTAGGNQFQTTSEHLNNIAKDFITPGFVGPLVNNTGAGGTGAFAANAQGSPNNTVAVTAGVAYATVTPTSQRSQVVRIEAQTTQTVTIAPNSTGSTRFDWIYIKVDPTKAANPAVDSTDVSTLYTSRSTSNVTDNGAPPTFGLLVAIITVANGFSSIANASILGKRTQAVLASGSVVSASIADGAIAYVDLLSTIFSGQIATGANSGSAGGTTNLLNLGGVKICWGTGAAISTGTGPSVVDKTVVFPTTYAAPPWVAATPVNLVSNADQVVYVENGTTTTTGVTIAHYVASSSGGSLGAAWIAIGT